MFLQKNKKTKKKHFSLYGKMMYRRFHIVAPSALRYAQPRYVKCLFTDMQKQKNMFKNSLFFQKNANFSGK